MAWQIHKRTVGGSPHIPILSPWCSGSSDGTGASDGMRIEVPAEELVMASPTIFSLLHHLHWLWRFHPIQGRPGITGHPRTHNGRRQSQMGWRRSMRGVDQRRGLVMNATEYNNFRLWIFIVDSLSSKKRPTDNYFLFQTFKKYFGAASLS